MGIAKRAVLAPPLKRVTELEELARERHLLQELDQRKGMTHRAAEKLFKEFQKDCRWNETVTGWCGKVE